MKGIIIFTSIIIIIAGFCFELSLYLSDEQRKYDARTHYYNINLRIVKINSDCSITNDKFHNPQLCNTILFETLEKPKLYMEINTCKLQYELSYANINTEWLYNHQPGDTVYFDCLTKSLFFTIKQR